MAVNKHFEHIGDIDANIRSNLDSLQSAIQTDSEETMVWANNGASFFHYAAAQYKKDAGGAITYLDSQFNDVTARNDLFAGEYIKRYGDAADYIRLENDKITLAAGNNANLVIEDDKITAIQDVLIQSDSKKLILGAGTYDMALYYDGINGHIDLSGITACDLHLSCGQDKTLVLDEPVWKDINLGSALLNVPAASNPTVDEFKDEGGSDTGIETLAFAVGDKISGSFEMQHDYKQGTNVYFHVHWQGIAAPSGTDNVQWQIIYTISRDGQTLDAAVTLVSGDTAFDTQYEFARTVFPAIDGSSAGNNSSNIQIGDQFLFQLSRIAADGDAYAGAALIATVGLHYKVDTMGSRTIATK